MKAPATLSSPGKDIWNRVFATALIDTHEHLVDESFRLHEGIEPIGGTPEQFAAFIRDEIDKYANVVKAAGIKAE